MRLQQAIKLYAMSPASEGHSTLPAHDHPEQLLGRDKQRKGGADKGGVTAGGPGSGRHKSGLIRLPEFEKVRPSQDKDLIRHPKFEKKKPATPAGWTGKVQADMVRTKSKGATRFHKHKVVDRAGRVVNSFKTRKEAERASDGNPYTTVVSNSAPTTSQPRDNKTSGQVRDMLRDNPSDNRIDEQNKIKRG